MQLTSRQTSGVTFITRHKHFIVLASTCGLNLAPSHHAFHLHVLLLKNIVLVFHFLHSIIKSLVNRKFSNSELVLIRKGVTLGIPHFTIQRLTCRVDKFQRGNSWQSNPILLDTTVPIRSTLETNLQGNHTVTEVLHTKSVKGKLESEQERESVTHIKVSCLACTR